MNNFPDELWIDPVTTIGYSKQLNDDYQRYYHEPVVNDLSQQIVELLSAIEELSDEALEITHDLKAENIVLEQRVAALENALKTISYYGRDGICPYGCDAPSIAKSALVREV